MSKTAADKTVTSSCVPGRGRAPCMAQTTAAAVAAAASRPAPRANCDAPDGALDSSARRDDAFAAIGAAARLDLGPVFSGEWAGRWRSFMPMARVFYVLDPGRWTGSLRDVAGTLPLAANAWAFLPPGREIEHDQPPGFNVVSVHFRIALRGRPNPFFGRPLRGGGAPELREVFLAAAAGAGEGGGEGDGGLSRLPATFALKGALWTLLGRVAQAEGPALAEGLSRGAEFQKIFEAVDDEPERVFSVSEMARMAGLGESSFTKRFRATMGTSPHAWTSERRARAAAEALLEPGATVSGVAARFGFGSEFYFSRFFKARFGASPSAWRSRCRV